MNKPNKDKTFQVGLFFYGQHMGFLNALIDNKIEFETKHQVEYGDGNEIEGMAFFVSRSDAPKALEIKKQYLSETPEFKSYPKFKKIFWIIIAVFLFVLIIVLLIIEKYNLINFLQ